MIDPQSLDRYRSCKGGFGERIRKSVSWKEGVFRQYDGRCAMLNRSGLCDLILELGAEALCDTCARYPRHTEEFENVREYSLSLSCPEAARMMLEEQGKLVLLTEDTAEEEEFEEGFDFLLYTNLADARQVLMKVLEDRSLTFAQREMFGLAFSGRMQEYLEEGDYPGLEEWIAAAGAAPLSCKADGKWTREESRYDRMKEELSVLEQLERLDPGWQELLTGEHMFLAHTDPEAYSRIYGEFLRITEEDRERRLEKLALFFIYTYFCGAVYDDGIYPKAALAFFSAEWIQELLMMEWYIKGSRPDGEAWIRMSYRYAREIEHSDSNLTALDDYFWDRTHPE